MTYSFNLIDEPWIPCVQMDGHVMEYSLYNTLAQAHQLRSVQGNTPLETAAVYRLMLAVIHSALKGPATQTEWRNLWQKKKWDMADFDTYLNAQSRKTRFDLFDKKRPFYQIKDERVKPKTASQLTHGMGTANELFDHESVTENVVFTCAEAARMLLVGQVFGLGGGCDPKQKLYLSSGAWTKGIIFFAEGDNLFETLMLNTLLYKDDRPINRLGKDLPAWDMDDPYEDERNKPNGYLDYLTWQNRRFLLFPETIQGKVMVRQMTIAPGLVMGAENFFDPMKQYKKGKKDWIRLDFKEEKGLWRDSHLLLHLSRKDNQGDSQPPQFIDRLAELVDESILDKKHLFHYMAYGIGMDPENPQMARIILYKSEHLPVPFSYFQSNENEDLVGTVRQAIEFADNVRAKLSFATSVLAKFFISPTADLKDGKQPDSKDIKKLASHYGAERFFWSRLEVPFYEFLQTMPEDESALSRWKETLQETAWEALKNAERMAGENTKALKAATRAEGVLYGELKKLFPESQPQKEVPA